MHQNVRGRNQNQKVHFTKAAQVEVLSPRVSDGADLREEATSHNQLGRVDLENLT